MSRPVVVITGSRTLTDVSEVLGAFDRVTRRLFHQWPTARLRNSKLLWLHGGAKGREGRHTVDTIIAEHLSGYDAVIDGSWNIRCVRPDYDRHPPGYAPLQRNEAMVEQAGGPAGGAVVAIWDGKSRGTAHTIGLAADRRVPCFVEMIYP